MTRSRFTPIAGFAALVGGLLWLMALAVAQAASSEFVGLLAVPTLFLVIGLGGLQLRRATRRGVLSKLGAALTLIGSLMLAYGSIGRLDFSGTIAGVAYGPFVFTGVAGGALVFGAGAALIAISAIAAGVLPRLSPIPLLVGALGVAAAGGLALARQLSIGPTVDVFPFEAIPLAALWAVFGLGWLWLGYLLWSERVPDPTLL